MVLHRFLIRILFISRVETIRLILNREITDGEPANNSYEILKFWPILSLAILIKRILIKKQCNHSFCFRHWVKVIVHIPHLDLNGKDIMYSIWDVRCPWMEKSSCTIRAIKIFCLKFHSYIEWSNFVDNFVNAFLLAAGWINE